MNLAVSTISCDNKYHVMKDIESLKTWLKDYHTETTAEEFDQFISYLFNSNRDGISILDNHFTIVGVNYTMERWYAHKGNFIGRKCYDIYHSRNFPCEGCPTLTAIKTKRYATSLVPYEDSEGVQGTQELCAFPLFDDSNSVTGVIEYVRAVEDEKIEERVVENLKRRLRFQEQTLNEQEIALQVLIRQRERSEKRLADSIKRNIDTLIYPVLDDLKRRLEGTEFFHQIMLLETYTENLLSPLASSFTSRDYNLTTREIQVADLIKQGKTSKEIAGLLSISVKAVDYHRMNVRRKLGLTNTSENLRNRLCNLDGS
jgi:DNA-binding CsgD family transcriptional regulator